MDWASVGAEVGDEGGARLSFVLWGSNPGVAHTRSHSPTRGVVTLLDLVGLFRVLLS